MTTMHAVANKLFISLLFYTLPIPQSKEQSASQVPITIHLTLKQLWLCDCVCITYVAPYTTWCQTVILYRGFFVQININLCTPNARLQTHTFTKLILLCSTCSRAQHFRNELITPTQLPCFAFFRGCFELIICKQGWLSQNSCYYEQINKSCVAGFVSFKSLNLGIFSVIFKLMI